MPSPGGLWWLLCCRGGFTLLRRDYGDEGGPGAAGGEEAEEEEASFELRGHGQAPALQVNLTQPCRAGSNSSSERSLAVAEEMCSLIPEKKCRQVQEDPDPIMRGWLQREVRGGRKAPWWRPRKYWFVLTQESLDCYSGCEVGAQRLASLVLTSLCSVLWPDKQTYKETGYWAVTVFGRKHCYRLYTEHLKEAVHWVCALQKVIVSQAPVQTPTQLFMSDLEENHGSPEVLDQIYRNNPILRYTAGPIYAPLLPFPYGAGEGADASSRGYAALRDEAVKLFHSLQQLEGVREPALLVQGVLQTCLDLPPLVDEIYCQLVKQTTQPPAPGTPANLRYWQLLACMSGTFQPSPPVQGYLQRHLQRTESRFPGSEMARYGHFIKEALRKTQGRECVPSLEEIEGLVGHQEVARPMPRRGTAPCHVAIASHTTAQELGWGSPRADSASSIMGARTETASPHNRHACALLFEQGQASRPPTVARPQPQGSLPLLPTGCFGALLHLSLGDQELLLHTHTPRPRNLCSSCRHAGPTKSSSRRNPASPWPRSKRDCIYIIKLPFLDLLPVGSPGDSALAGQTLTV